MIDTRTWEEYRLEDVFTLKGGFYNKKPEHSVDGNIPFLASTENNNGTTEYYSIEDIKSWDKVGNEDDTLKNKIYDGNCIAVTVNGSVCNAFYQKDDFTCSHDITALYLKNHIMNSNIAMFLCTIIMKDKYRWSYGRKPHDVKKFGKSVVKLPATSSGEPDWQYMEDFVGGLHSKPITTSVKSSHVPFETEKWKEFRVGDLFTVELAKGDIKLDEMDLGNVALVSSGETNNGIVGYINSIGDGKSEIFPSNRITVDMFGNAFYQNNPFYAVSHGRVNILNPKFDMTDAIGLFITSVIKQEQYKYSYGRAVYSSVAENIIIKLPATPTGEPDWQYMEDYIKSLPYGDKLEVSA